MKRRIKHQDKLKSKVDIHENDMAYTLIFLVVSWIGLHVLLQKMVLPYLPDEWVAILNREPHVSIRNRFFCGSLLELLIEIIVIPCSWCFLSWLGKRNNAEGK